MATISQRISLEGSEDIRKQLEQLGAAGALAFKQIQDAAKKPITDPAQIDRTKQALDQLAATSAKLGPEFQKLADSSRRFGTEGARASQQVAAGLNQTEVAAQRTSASLAQAAAQARSTGQDAGTGLISAATAFKIAAAGIIASIGAVVDALTKGTVETGKGIAESAEKLNLSIVAWMRLRRVISDTNTPMDQVQGSVSRITDLLEKAQGGIQRFSTGMTQQAQKVGDSIIVFTKFGQAESVVKTEADKAATALGKMGISVEDIAKGDPVILLRNLAQSISDTGDAATQKERGLAAFGDKWQEIVEVLRSGREVLDDASKSLSDFGRENRGLSGADIAKVIQLEARWTDLGRAIRATRDLIGSLFLDSAFIRADWLTKLIDGSTELLRRWLKLADAKRGAFLAGLGDSPAEQGFKVMIALGDQLAGIWKDVLVPAGEALLEVFAGVSDNIEGVTKSQVAAFFISAAAAAVALVIALKGIAFVLSPIASLLSFAFSPLGVILIAAAAAAALFWDELKQGANSVLALIPQEVKQVQQALQLLFKGDFAGAWKKFSEAAVTAFTTIKQAFLSSDIGTQFLVTVGSIVAAFIGLRLAARGTALAINAVFGTSLTGPGLVAIVALGQMTGALQALASIAVIAGVATRGIVGAIVLLGAAVGAVPAAFALLATALAGLIVYLDPKVWTFYADAARGALEVIAPLVAPITQAVQQLSALVGGEGSGAWGIFRNAALSAINPIYGALRGLLNLIELVKAGLSTLSAAGPPTGGTSGTPTGEAGPFARGGWVGGRGTGTSDSNLAWVSRGEYITPASAVRQPGVLAFLEALRRSGGNLSRALDGMGRFALGGMVPRPMAIPAFAAGGLAGGMSNVTIQFPGLPPIGGLRASSDVVDQLHKAAALAQVRSGGRKPSRYS